VTSREWRSDRRAVFERDGYTCCNCSSVGGEGEPTTVRTQPVGDIPLNGTVHTSSLVTVCSRCFTLLQGGEIDTETAVDNAELFRIARRATRKQGEAIADVASFASLVTSLPVELNEGRDPADEYCKTRRDVLLALAVVETHLERIETVPTETLDQSVIASLSAFSGQATALHREIREIVTLCETVATGLGRCHGCFEPIESADSTCQSCRLDARSLTEWRQSDSTDAVAFDRLFAEINERLQHSGETTEALTDRTTELAAALLDE